MEDTESRQRGWVEKEEERLGCTTWAELGGDMICCTICKLFVGKKKKERFLEYDGHSSY